VSQRITIEFRERSETLLLNSSNNYILNIIGRGHVLRIRIVNVFGGVVEGRQWRNQWEVLGIKTLPIGRIYIKNVMFIIYRNTIILSW